MDHLIQTIQILAPFYDVKTHRLSPYLLQSQDAVKFHQLTILLGRNLGHQTSETMTEIDRQWLVRAYDAYLTQVVEGIDYVELWYRGRQNLGYHNQLHRAIWLKYNPETLLRINSGQMRIGGILAMMSIFASSSEYICYVAPHEPSPLCVVFDFAPVTTSI